MTADEIATGAVGSSEVADGSLRKEDVGVLSGTVNLDPPVLRRAQASQAGMCANVTASVPRIAVGDQVILSAPNTLMNGITGTAVVQPTADTLTVKICNMTVIDNLDDVAHDWATSSSADPPYDRVTG